MEDNNKKTKLQKFKEATPLERYQMLVHAPHRGMAKVTKAIWDTKSVKHVGERRKKIKSEKHVPKVKAVAIDAGLGMVEGGAKLIGLAASGAATTAFWIFGNLLDNKIPQRFGEKLDAKRADKKAAGIDTDGFFKNNPNLRAYVAYTLVMAGVLAGGGKIVENTLSGKEKDGNEKRIKKEIDVFKIDVNKEKAEVKKQKEAIHWYIVKDIIQSEGFVEEMYSDVGQKSGYLTIGSGYMVGKVNPKGDKDKATLKERKAYFKKVIGRPLVNGTKITHQENRVLVTSWLNDKVYPKVDKQIKVPISAKLYSMLIIGAYNRGENIYAPNNSGEGIMAAVNAGKSYEEIAPMLSDLFVNGNAGLIPKYGIEAHKLLGNITDEDVLESLANSPYKMKTSKLWEDKKLRMEYGKDVAKDLRAISNADIYKNGRVYKQLSVKEYLTKHQVEFILAGKLFGDNALDFIEEFQKEEKEKQQALPKNVQKSQSLNEQGEALYTDGDYTGAVKKFEQAIKENPKNYILYSNISIAYYKAGNYAAGLKVVNDLLESEYLKDMPSTERAYAHYNAAMCAEKLGDNEKDLQKKFEIYAVARDHIKESESLRMTEHDTFKKRVQGKINKTHDEIKAQKSKKDTGKKTAFNSGVSQVKVMQGDKKILQIIDVNEGRA